MTAPTGATPPGFAPSTVSDSSPSSVPPAGPATIFLDVLDLGRRCPKDRAPFVSLLRTRFRVEIADDPDFVIYSDGSDVHRLYACKKIYWTPEVNRPDFRECDYALTTHCLDDPRHLRLPLGAIWLNPRDLVRQPGEYAEWRPRKTEFCCYFSSYVTRKTRHRQEFFETLSRYRQVHAAGRAFNNIGREIPFDPQAKHDFLCRYKFCMAFENESVPGYTTEKIVEAMRARCVPIYWGNPRIAEDLNPRSFINADDFPSLPALAEHVARVDRDDVLYRSYFEQPYFHGNTPGPVFRAGTVLDFFAKIFADPTPPLATRRRRWLRRWFVLKRKKRHRLSWLTPDTPRPLAPAEAGDFPSVLWPGP